MMTFKFYDTCSLLLLNDELFQDPDNTIAISSITLKELELIKVSNDKTPEVRCAARQLLNNIENAKAKIDLIIFTESMLKPIREKDLPISNDMKILACAVYYDEHYHPDETVFVTNDLSLKNIANLFFGEDSIEIVGYEKEDPYQGFKDITLNNDQMIDFYSNQDKNLYNLLIGEYLIIRNEDGEIIDQLCWDEYGYRRLRYNAFSSRWFGEIKPKGIHQALAADSFRNNQLTMLRGPAGSGKTYLSLGFLFSKLEKNKINKIVIFCNTVATRNSAKLGFYPGTRDEKLLDSQIGNLLESKLGNRQEVQKLIEEGKLILLPLSDIRGYETPEYSGVYISEAQNLDIDLMQLALSRIGETSICIIDGDDNTQVDLQAYAGEYNGMRRVSKVFRGSDVYGEIKLQEVQRSKIADLARKLK